jgi:hypothetical protein
MKKIMGITIIALALVIGIVPLFTDCLSQGKALTTTTGAVVPMKCHWTSIAEIGMAIPLGMIGISNLFNKRKETFTNTSIFGSVLGALVILFPTVLIGVCSNPMMLCNMVERPALILAGGLVIGANLVTFVNSRKMMELGA